VIETVDVELPHGIRLACRVAGPPFAPVLLFLHGFPEAAFAWDALLVHFADRFRCVAPNQRGYPGSSAPLEVEAYRPTHLIADVVALAQHLGGRLEALVAHDWGGAVAWGVAASHPELMRQLVVVNAPHAATFLRDLQHDPAQQAASAYMNFLRRPDAERLLAENDFARLWRFLEGDAPPALPRPGAGWLTERLKDRYREAWRAGLAGPLNWYRASPLHPPMPGDDSVMRLTLPPEATTVDVPTRVVWAEADAALRPSLLEGLDAYVPRLTVVRVPEASHWVIHEQPARIAQEIEAALKGG
jgi:pimeloyl-ACP methyl ester carboxylesterase